MTTIAGTCNGITTFLGNCAARADVFFCDILFYNTDPASPQSCIASMRREMVDNHLTESKVRAIQKVLIICTFFFAVGIVSLWCAPLKTFSASAIFSLATAYHLKTEPLEDTEHLTPYRLLTGAVAYTAVSILFVGGIKLALPYTAACTALAIGGTALLGYGAIGKACEGAFAQLREQTQQ